MYLTMKQQVKQLSKEEYKTIRKLSHIAKNITNQAIYNVRQHYFNEQIYLNYYDNYALLKESDHYKTLNSNMAQQLLKEVDGMFKSFFGLLKQAKQGDSAYRRIRLPNYLPKDGFTTLIIGDVRIKGDHFLIPYSNVFRKHHKRIAIKIPPKMVGKRIKEIRLVPKVNARYFEIQYTYEVELSQRELNNQKALAIDFGITNLATCVTSTGESFIVDGKRLKSINQWYNKEKARLQSIKARQKLGRKPTKRQLKQAFRRNNKVNDYMAKTARVIIRYCLEHDIGTLVCGYHNTFQRNSNIGKRNNQTFVQIPFGRLFHKLQYLCEYYGISFVEQEESYTSKASFFDKDVIPVYEKDHSGTYTFSGRRVKRGLYRTQNGYTLNADVNGALNILRKSNVVSLKGLYDRGELDTPIRIKIA